MPKTRQNMEGTKTKMPFKMRRVQFPVKLAWVMTINKSQGQTLARGGVYLPDPVFSHGQLYVAASRVGAPEQLRFLVTRAEESARWQGWLRDPRDDCDKVFTTNVVSYEALGRNAPTKHPHEGDATSLRLSRALSLSKSRSPTCKQNQTKQYSSGARPVESRPQQPPAPTTSDGCARLPRVSGPRAKKRARETTTETSARDAAGAMSRTSGVARLPRHSGTQARKRDSAGPYAAV